jgi:hypothetical protein
MVALCLMKDGIKGKAARINEERETFAQNLEGVDLLEYESDPSLFQKYLEIYI